MPQLSSRIRSFAVVGAATALIAPVAVTTAAAEPATDSGRPVVTTTTPVAYQCFVTYQGGGSTIVNYGLTLTGRAPAEIGPRRVFTADVSFPQITPNPKINVEVRDVRLTLRVADDARLVSASGSGGSGLGAAGGSVRVQDGTVVVSARGPLAGGVPFTLPTAHLVVRAGNSGSAAVRASGATLSDPQFSWVRTDPADGALRPFACFTPAVDVTSTTVSATR